MHRITSSSKQSIHNIVLLLLIGSSQAVCVFSYLLVLFANMDKIIENSNYLMRQYDLDLNTTTSAGRRDTNKI